MCKAKGTPFTGSSVVASFMQVANQGKVTIGHREPPAQSGADATASFKTIDTRRVNRSKVDTFMARVGT